MPYLDVLNCIYLSFSFTIFLSFIPGYANYPATSQAAAAAAVTPASAAAATLAARYPRIPVPQLTTPVNGTIRPTLPVGLAPSQTPTLGALQTGLYQTALSTVTPTLPKTIPRLPVQKLPLINNYKGIKRKADDSHSTSSEGGESNGKADSTTTEKYTLYCKCCRVTLNAQAQARQHYEGKSHAKKMRLFVDSDDESESKEEKKVRINLLFILSFNLLIL